MYLIGSGKATVQIVPGRHAKLHEGDFFGEMSLFERRRHKHDVVAGTICRVYVVDSEGLPRLSRRHPEIVCHIREVAKERERENERFRSAARLGRTRNSAKKVGETEAQ